MTDDKNAAVLARLTAAAAERFKRDVSELDPDADLYDALGIDSVGALELLTDLEETFEVEIPDYEVQDVRTFRDLAGVVAGRI